MQRIIVENRRKKPKIEENWSEFGTQKLETMVNLVIEKLRSRQELSRELKSRNGGTTRPFNKSKNEF